MFEPKDISLLLIGGAMTLGVAALQAFQSKQIGWASFYTVLLIVCAAWGCWPVLRPLISGVFDLTAPAQLGGRGAQALKLEQAVTSISLFMAMGANLLRRYVARDDRWPVLFGYDAMQSMVFCTAVVILVGPFFFRNETFAWLSRPSPTHTVSLVYLMVRTGDDLLKPLKTKLSGWLRH